MKKLVCLHKIRVDSAIYLCSLFPCLPNLTASGIRPSDLRTSPKRSLALLYLARLGGPVGPKTTKKVIIQDVRIRVTSMHIIA